MVIDQIETHPNKLPHMPYKVHASGPRIHVSCKQLYTMGGHIVNIIIKSENAKLTTSMLEGVLNDFVDKKI